MTRTEGQPRDHPEDHRDEKAAAAHAAAGGRSLISIPPKGPIVDDIRSTLKETFFPENPITSLRKLRTPRERFFSVVAYIFPVFHWARGYNLLSLKDDVIAGLTIGSLCIPQDIGYAKLAGVPPIYGLFTSFVPPLIYAALGVSREIAIGPVAVVSILLGTLARQEFPAPAAATAKCDTTSTKFINNACTKYREEYLALIFTATFFTGIFQAALGLTRLGFIIEYLSHAAIVGFMAGAAITIALQQLKGLLGISTASFTKNTDIISVLDSVFTHTKEWSWRTILIGVFFLIFLLTTKYIAKKKPKLFWVSAIAPLTSVILSTLIVKFTKADEHGVAIVGSLKKGINPSSVGKLVFHGDILKHALIIAVQSSLIALTEGVAIGRTFAGIRGYHIDGNKEMVAFGAMNLAGACTSCYVATGSFSRSAVNYQAGVKTPVANIVMSLMVMVVLLALTGLFHDTPNAILASIIINAVLSLIDFSAMYKIWKLDFGDFICMLGALLGVVFKSVEIGLLVAVALSVARVLLHVTRPHTATLGKIRGTNIYRNVQQYPEATTQPGILVVRIDTAIYFANANYLRERIVRWVEEEEERLALEGNKVPVQFVILELSPVTNIDTTGIHSLEDLLTNLSNKNIQLAFANPGTIVAQKLKAAGLVDKIGLELFFLTAGEAVETCTARLRVNAL